MVLYCNYYYTKLSLSLLIFYLTNVKFRLHIYLLYHSITHCDAFGVQLTASVSIINSGEGLPPPVASPFEATLLNTTNLTVYVVPGFKSSMFVCILLFPVLGTSCALILLL